MISALYQTNTFIWKFINANSMKQKFTSRNVTPLRHILINQSVFAITPECLEKKQQIPIL